MSAQAAGEGVTGTLHGRRGTFILQHVRTMTPADVVPDGKHS